MITSLSGTNAFQLQSELQKRIAAFVAEHGGLALEKIDASEAEFPQILGAVESLPFLASKKMVVVYDMSLNKEGSEAIELLADRAGETTELVIVESKPDKRSAYYKQLKKLADFHEFNEMDEVQLASWLASEAKSRGAKLSRPDADYLVRRVGQDQLRLSNELDKLAQYDTEITRKNIDLLTEESPSSTIFNLVDSVFSGNLSRALAIYDDQRKQKVEPQAIHGMLVWQMHAVAVAAAAPTGTSHTQIAKDAGISPYVAQKSQRIANNMGRGNVIRFLELLREIDYRGKHEALDYDEALRYAIVSLAV